MWAVALAVVAVGVAWFAVRVPRHDVRRTPLRRSVPLHFVNAALTLPCWLVDRFGYRVPKVGYMLGRPLRLRDLMAAAERRTKLNDWAETATFPSLYASSVERLNEASLSPFGRLLAFDYLMRRLEARLRVVDAAASRPPRPDLRLCPVFVVGLPRTGTTFLHRLLALDPRFRCPETHELLDPLNPRPLAKRLAYWEAKLALLDRLAPRLRRIHALGARPPRNPDRFSRYGSTRECSGTILLGGLSPGVGELRGAFEPAGPKKPRETSSIRRAEREFRRV